MKLGTKDPQYWIVAINPSGAEMVYSNFPRELGQYHGCWCFGDLRHQGISNHDFD